MKNSGWPSEKKRYSTSISRVIRTAAIHSSAICSQCLWAPAIATKAFVTNPVDGLGVCSPTRPPSSAARSGGGVGGGSAARGFVGIGGVVGVGVGGDGVGGIGGGGRWWR